MEIRSIAPFDEWIDALRDHVHRGRILDRVGRLAEGNPGDSRGVGDGVIELRLHFGPGYRVYYVKRGTTIYLLLCGGDKQTQEKDIKLAKQLAKSNEEIDDEE